MSNIRAPDLFYLKIIDRSQIATKKKEDVKIQTSGKIHG